MATRYGRSPMPNSLPADLELKQPVFKYFDEETYNTEDDGSQTSDEDRWSLDGFDSDFEALDSDSHSEEVHHETFAEARDNYRYPRQSHQPSTVPNQRYTYPGQSSRLRRSDPPTHFSWSPRLQSMPFRRPFGSDSYRSPASEDEDSLSESSVTTEETRRGYFAYGFNNRRYTRSGSTMGYNFFQWTDSTTNRQRFEEPESEDDSDFMSSDSSSTPRLTSSTIPNRSVDLKTLREAFRLYELRWAALPKDITPRLTFKAIPWPQYPPPSSSAGINLGDILLFLTQGSDLGVRLAVRQALLRFHPDKAARLLMKVEESERESVTSACITVARYLNEINSSL